MVPFVDLKAQYQSVKDDIDAAIADVISQTAFVGGPFVRDFERKWATYAGLEHCISCANGTDAIEILLAALGVGPGDDVLVPANTWISTAEAVTTVGARPVFVDCDAKTYTIDPEYAERVITPNTRAIIPVHLYGCAADMDAIGALAQKHDLRVLEDCAQAHGALYREQQVGTFGDGATFSFYPGKNLGAYGDAGAIVTNDDHLAKRARQIANHGRLGKFDHAIEGRNSRLDGLQAAILKAKLPHLPAWTEARRIAAARYDALLRKPGIEDRGVVLPTAPNDRYHVYHLYVLRVPKRDSVRDKLAAAGVATGIHYPIALPFVQAYRHFDHSPEQFPVAYSQMSQLLSLPLYPELRASQQRTVVDTLEQALADD
jgi:dTDP-4-amino-4,6-dideoxygalactose transaminase